MAPSSRATVPKKKCSRVSVSIKGGLLKYLYGDQRWRNLKLIRLAYYPDYVVMKRSVSIETLEILGVFGGLRHVVRFFFTNKEIGYQRSGFLSINKIR